MASDSLRHKSLDSETQLTDFPLRLQLPQASTSVLSPVSPTSPAEGEKKLVR